MLYVERVYVERVCVERVYVERERVSCKMPSPVAAAAAAVVFFAQAILFPTVHFQFALPCHPHPPPGFSSFFDRRGRGYDCGWGRREGSRWIRGSGWTEGQNGNWTIIHEQTTIRCRRCCCGCGCCCCGNLGESLDGG